MSETRRGGVFCCGLGLGAGERGSGLLTTAGAAAGQGNSKTVGRGQGGAEVVAVEPARKRTKESRFSFNKHETYLKVLMLKRFYSASPLRLPRVPQARPGPPHVKAGGGPHHRPASPAPPTSLVTLALSHCTAQPRPVV